jgi:hypothetical protein
MPQCDRHPGARMKLLKTPPKTANTELVFVSGAWKRVCDLLNYYRCPICKTHFAGPKENN